MAERITKVIEGPNARVQIVHRFDGAFTYRILAKFSEGWSAPGPDLGIFDSAESAETEARRRVWWLSASS